ncbi:hypothetical protein SAMN06265338_103187 [Rhodoblastus acidophilus]|uniref:Uncharacterized protein n=1 Tax=Rhodoblastus acidophilus TaxID=1074 RepID=A0A212RAY9_RHOAC|nr:hypothetical protein [Rhodoblastus acidophilus]MCW2317444.1 hypothetical protein [Rhodoblastus acidophilus]PPQ39345.1 hypothetical protein CKO16_06210 [Rhodoblastus acidophilus]RAI22417.1 hypothetical protein CH337_05405 [Rhodoblastus acidophilus]SNB69242.1 hypothetical protein SAMN06265338_103187 [Rhodoblastus acidophilus]
MIRRVAVVAICLSTPAVAEEWRFCVGVAPASHETVISDIFASGADSARLEQRLATYYRAHHGRTLTFQCPRGGDRVAALNGQTAALQFNRSVGYAVNGLPLNEVRLAVGEDLF